MARITGDLTEAGRLAAGGEDVVVVLPAEAGALAIPQGPGRVAVMVGDPDDPAVSAAAAEMAAELFGRREVRRGLP